MWVDIDDGDLPHATPQTRLVQPLMRQWQHIRSVTKLRPWSPPTTMLIGGVHVEATVKVLLRKDWSVAAPTTNSAYNIKADCRKLWAHGSMVPSRTLGLQTLTLAQEPAMEMTTMMTASRLASPPCKDSFIRNWPGKSGSH
jgi:hypothetical protein